MEKINLEETEYQQSDEKIRETVKTYVKENLSKVTFDFPLTDEEIEKYIYKVYDYIKDYLYCRDCPGIGHCDKEKPYTTTKLTKMFGIIDEAAVQCDEVNKLAELTTRFILRDYPEEWNTTDIKSGNLDLAKERAVVMKRIMRENKSAYVVGEPGSGKSYLVTAIVNTLAKQQKVSQICYLDTPFRCKEIYEAHDEEREEMINRYSRCNLLVFDKFGEEFVNDWIRDNILIPIIKFRSERNLQTIYVSELLYSDLINHLAPSRTQSAKEKATDIVNNYIKVECDQEIVLSQLKGLYQEKL